MNYLTNEQVKSFVEMRNLFEEEEIRINETVYQVLTQEEIDEKFYDFQVELFEEIGLNSLVDSALTYVLDNFVDTTYFEQLQYEMITEQQEYYTKEEIDDLKEMYQVDDIEEILDYDLTDRLEEDCLDYVRNIFGDDEICRMIEENKLINMIEFVDWLKETDGYDILANYDGNVYEHSQDGETYYVFRTE